MTYRDFPETIGEIRASETRNAKDWSARDVLVSMLRRIDDGDLEIESLVIGYTLKSDNATVGYYNASPSGVVSIGIIEKVKSYINEGDA